MYGLPSLINGMNAPNAGVSFLFTGYPSPVSLYCKCFSGFNFSLQKSQLNIRRILFFLKVVLTTLPGLKFNDEGV